MKGNYYRSKWKGVKICLTEEDQNILLKSLRGGLAALNLQKKQADKKRRANRRIGMQPQKADMSRDGCNSAITPRPGNDG